MVLLAACVGGSSSSNVNAEWSEKPQSLTVVISEPSVLNKDDLADDIPEYSQNFVEWFSQRLKIELELRTKMKPEIRIEKAENYETAQFPVQQSMVTFHLPNPEKMANLHGMVLAIHPVQFWRRDDNCSPHPFGCFYIHHLMAKGTYAYMDMDSRKVVGYGFFFFPVSFTMAMARGDWEESVRSMVASIVENTPLK